MKPEIKVRLLFSVMLMLGVTLVTMMGITFVKQFSSASFRTWDMYQMAAAILLNLMILFTFIRIGWRMVRQSIMSYKWMRHFRCNIHEALTRHLQDKYRSWGIEMIVTQDDDFVALTIGMLRSKIVVSSGLFSRFDEQEIEAILLHERFHLSNRDNFKLFIMTLCTEGFGYLPTIRVIFRYFEIWKELLADRFAIKQMGTEYYLGRVLFKLTAAGGIQKSEVGVHFAEAAMSYRIMQVLEPEKKIQVPMAIVRPMLLFGLLLIFFTISGSS
ncbi:M56 family metallopeptidase [Marinicrinis lubricantis]|uniref:M56 family metallopeptidase n=1 Tax=Marinicrinis lubricantis TaxID=2086470 RepID=A0ABW1IN92_9BACL